MVGVLLAELPFKIRFLEIRTAKGGRSWGGEQIYNMSVSYSNRRIRDKTSSIQSLRATLLPHATLSCPLLSWTHVLSSISSCQNKAFQKRRRYTDVPQQTRSICLTSNDRRHSYQDRLVGPVLLYGNFYSRRRRCLVPPSRF